MKIENHADDFEFDELDKEIAEMLEAHQNAEPILLPNKTMLFRSESKSVLYDEQAIPKYASSIVEAVDWAKNHGIYEFLADYVTPFGLLALEVLLTLKKTDHAIRVYSIRSRHIGMRDSYRTPPETELNLLLLLSDVDYFYTTTPFETLTRIFPQITFRCSERGLRSIY